MTFCKLYKHETKHIDLITHKYRVICLHFVTLLMLLPKKTGTFLVVGRNVNVL